MNQEIQLLDTIKKNQSTSQRDIAKTAGISLGMVNILIKRFVKVGLIKMEKLDGPKIRYMLTADGFTYLSKKTIHYMNQSIKTTLKVRAHMMDVITSQYDSGELVKVHFVEDEMYLILKDVLDELGMGYEVYSERPVGKYLHWGTRAVDDPDEGIDVLQGFEMG